MVDVVAGENTLSETRARGLRRLLLVVLALSCILMLLAVGTVAVGYLRSGLVVAVIGVALLASSGLTLRALPQRGRRARNGCILTGVLLVLCALPLVSVGVGLAMAVAGVGLLFVALGPDRERA